MANFGATVTHFFASMESQAFDCSCLLHEKATTCGADTCGAADLAVVGTPCQPYSRQRVKRSEDGSVRAHKKYDATFKEFLDLLQSYEPKACVGEQVEGFTSPESAADPTTPFERRGLFQRVTHS